MMETQEDEIPIPAHTAAYNKTDCIATIRFICLIYLVQNSILP